jgi:hypothetical protein
MELSLSYELETKFNGWTNWKDFGTFKFIMHGIDSSIPEEYVRFKEKYELDL